MAENIIKTSYKSGDGTKKGFAFDRNANDDRVFEIELDNKFNFQRWSDYERNIRDKVVEFIDENYPDYFDIDSDIQFFIVD